MKKIFTLLFFCALAQFSFAQEVPDFTVTTVHGEEFNLYSHLEEGKTVVLDIFFVNCSACNTIAPSLQELNMEWGDGTGDVVFISLTDVDTNEEIIPFEETHSLTFPAAGTDGGATEAVQPYKNGEFGDFFGYPTISVINPDKTITFDIWGDSIEGIKSSIHSAIEESGASFPSSVYESKAVASLSTYPNPVVNELNINVELTETTSLKVEVVDAQGKLVQSINKGATAAGQQVITVDMTELASGNYFVSLVGNKERLASFNVVK